MSDLASVRVNSAMLPRYCGKNVRLTCRPIQFMGDSATVAASDGGQVTIKLLPDSHMAPDTFYEVIGKVTNGKHIKMYHYIPVGNALDIKMVDDTIKLMHDPRFYSKLFSADE
ncbi:replication factor A protein 3 [Mycena alexandri]|uniref:Replication factor A protein 3 n=1 Tax=Mycena alexandri TaxID=1745969 RepID=A0AAD6T152_9AGAR|nr:replication factor A protein 3 [Mycena alexandri]